MHAYEKPSVDGAGAHTRTDESRLPVSTWLFASAPTQRTSCSWPARVAESLKSSRSTSMGSASAIEFAGCAGEDKR